MAGGLVSARRRALTEFARLSRPAYLLAGAGLYACGLAIADYLGLPIDPGAAWVGLTAILLLQLTTHYLVALDDWQYLPPPAPAGADPSLLDPPGPAFSHTTPLSAAITCGGLFAVLTTAQLITSQPPLLSWILLLLLLLAGFWFAVPPLRLRYSGYGELLASFALALLVPSYAFSLQTGETHRLVLVSTAPLVALHFAMLIAQQLEDYSAASAQKRRVLMVRIGWQAAMRAHDLALAAAGVLFAIAFLQTVPLRLPAGALLLLPLAVVQAWQMHRIRQGLPPAWRLLRWNSVGLFGLGIYVVLVGYLLS
ncbi:MAG: UbiA family prenyltransferase [Anaerolineales bacterium]|nr:UbiA family prenyltransferase [Anaerolineales bacterium]